MAARFAATLLVLALASQACNKGNKADESPSPEAGPNVNSPADTSGAARTDTTRTGGGAGVSGGAGVGGAADTSRTGSTGIGGTGSTGMGGTGADTSRTGTTGTPRPQ